MKSFLVTYTSVRRRTYELRWPYMLAILWLVAILAATQSRAGEQTIDFEMRPGDSLWDIARLHLDFPDRWQELLNNNQISEPTLLKTGETVSIPQEWFVTSPMRVWVSALAGDASILRETGPSILVEGIVDDPERTTISTLAHSRMTLEFDNGCTITLAPNSRLVLDRVRYFGQGLIPDISVTLQSGSAEVTYPDTGLNRGKLNIRTHSATTSVRGTEFRVRVNEEDQSTRGETIKGLINLSNEVGVVALPADTGSLAKPGEAPLPPVQLLPAPDLASLPSLVNELPLRVAFAAVPNAKSYRVAILPKDAPLAPVSEQLQNETSIEFAELSDGEYIIRARSVDSNGLEGRDREHLVEIDARPRRPLLQQPFEDGRWIPPSTDFAWTVEDEGVRFAIEIASDEAFDDIVLAAGDLGETVYSLEEALPAGRYYWRVTSTDDQGDRGLPSAPQSFRVAPPPAPAATPGLSLDEEGWIVAQWPAVVEAARYRVEVASDPEFSSVRRREMAEGAKIRLGKALSGDNWVRVTAIDADGIEAEPSAPASIAPEAFPWWQTIGTAAGLAALALLLLL